MRLNALHPQLAHQIVRRISPSIVPYAVDPQLDILKAVLARLDALLVVDRDSPKRKIGLVLAHDHGSRVIARLEAWPRNLE